MAGEHRTGRIVGELRRATVALAAEPCRRRPSRRRHGHQRDARRSRRSCFRCLSIGTTDRRDSRSPRRRRPSRPSQGHGTCTYQGHGAWTSVCAHACEIEHSVGIHPEGPQFDPDSRVWSIKVRPASDTPAACRSERFNYVPRILTGAETSTHGFVV